MSDYLTYTLWRQREERMPRELEQQRVVQERLREQEQTMQEQELPLQGSTDSTIQVEPSIVEVEDTSTAPSESEAELVSR